MRAAPESRGIQGRCAGPIREFSRYQAIDDNEWAGFVNHFEYKSLDINNIDGFRELRAQTEALEERFRIPGNRLFYLALAPELFGSVSFNLKAGGMLEGEGWSRLVIEKPFGYDLESAEKLNEQIRQVFQEEEIFRIDHYLGKEMVQNIEVIRFANAFSSRSGTSSISPTSRLRLVKPSASKSAAAITTMPERCGIWPRIICFNC